MQGVQKSLSGYLAQEQVAWILRDRQINCVLDVGANVGQFARSLRTSGYTGRIVSFEPVGHLAARLKTAAEDDPDWHVCDFALGDTPGELEINVAHGDGKHPGTMSSLLPPSEFGQMWSARLRELPTEVIAVRRLDSVFEDAVRGIRDPRVFLKMDTQGYDLKTFAGAGQYLDSVLGLQSEVSCLPIYDGMPHMLDQLAAYEAAGFSPAGIYPVSRHRTSLRVIEFDVVMVKDQISGPAT
ncbi:MAG: FkbM family methyltransferase [Aeromicrobium sp.]